MKKKYLLFLIIIGFIAVLFLKNQYTDSLLTHANYGMPALIHTGEIDNLYLGSSMFRQAIDVQTLSDASADSFYLLAYNGNQPVYEYYQLKNLLDHQVKIKNLFVDMYVYSAWAEPKISDEKILLELDTSNKYTYWQRSCTSDSLANTKSFWQTFVTSNNELLLTWPVSSFLINQQFDRGSSLNQSPSASLDTLEAGAAPVIEAEINELQKEYLQKLIELAKSHDINLIFIETPKYQSIENNNSYINAMNYYCEILLEQQISCVVSESLKNDLPSSKYLSFYSFEHDNADYYADIYHLSYSGKKSFSQLFKTSF